MQLLDWHFNKKSTPSHVECFYQTVILISSFHSRLAGVEFPDTEHLSAGQSPGSDLSSLGENPRKISSFKLPPIVRKATTVRRSNSEREVVKGQTVKQFEPTRRSTWESIMTSLSDARVPLPWKRRGKQNEIQKAQQPEEAMSRDEKPAQNSKKTKSKKLSKKGKKLARDKIENLPPLSISEPANITAWNNDVEDNEHASMPYYVENMQNEENLKDENDNISDNNEDTNTPETALINLAVGDFIAIKVPEKHFIKGQPCVGKVVAETDERHDVLVHYYTGTYDGTFRPMMSRTSPYLRKVAIKNVLCKFEMKSDGSLSPTTAIRIRQMIERASS